MSEETRSDARDRSVVVGFVDTLGTALRRWADGSALVVRGRAGQRAIADATATSSLTRGGRRVLTWVRASYLYRWLTAEPDPHVVVIDLRTTRTVGPFVRALDWALTRAVAFTRESGLYRVGTATAAAVRRAPIRVAGIVLCVAALVSFVLTALTATVSPAGVLAHGAAVAVGLAGTRVRVPLEALAESRTARLLAAAFEPPEPPEPADRGDRDSPRLESDE